MHITTNCLEAMNSSLNSNPRTKYLVQTCIVTLTSEQISTIYIIRRVAAHWVQTQRSHPLEYSNMEIF